MSVLTVGKDFITVNGKEKKFAYGDVEYVDRWADPDKYRPEEYDLLVIKLENGNEIKGWSTGSGWDGYKYQNEQVIAWKRDYD